MLMVVGMLCLASLTQAADEIVKVYVGGKLVNFSPAARVRNGTTYAPLRAAAQAVGADVKWSAATQTAVVCTDMACANIKKSQGIVVNGSLLIPVRLMSQALGREVTWDAATRSVRIAGQ
jgi:hypothetical protein